MNKAYTITSVIKVSQPEKADVVTIRFLIVCGLISMLLFTLWFIRPEHIGDGLMYWLLTFALFFKLAKMLHEWYHYWSMSIPIAPELKTPFTVDVLTTACPGEPREMIIRTLKAMVAIRYPHTNYLCDEGDDPVLKQICNELGIVHVTRQIKINAKAGNINNALKQATGEICVVLDPDHHPIPEFLDAVLPYFENKEIGFVQCVQAYSNQSESFIAKGAAEQTYHFYGPMMMCMNTYGTVQAIGANCTFRRKALDSIGGHAAGLAEDMHTAMQLHAKGWRSLYIPEILTRGLVPATISSYYSQQLKWSRGTFELLFRTYPSLFKKFTWRQKIHYLGIPVYFLFGLINCIDIFIPLLALLLAKVPWEINFENFTILFVPLCGLSLMIRLFAQRWLLEKNDHGLHFAGGLLRTATWWIFLVGFIYSIFNIKVPYIPTPKEDVHENHWRLSVPNFLVIVVCAVMIVYGLSLDWSPYSIAMAFYGLINASILGFIIIVSQQKFLALLSNKIKSITFLNSVSSLILWAKEKVQHTFYTALRNGPIALMMGIAIAFFSYSKVSVEGDLTENRKEKILGGFYTGLLLKSTDIKLTNSFEKSFERELDILPLYDTLQGNILNIKNYFKSLDRNNYIPMVYLTLPKNKNNTVDWQGIKDGNYNDYLTQFAHLMRNYASPVFLNPELFPEGNTNTISPELMKKGWQYLYTYFNNMGISNLTWVWTPQSPDAESYYPGSQFIDWIGIRVLNYSKHRTDKDWRTFKQGYTPFRNKLDKMQKPVIIAELGSLHGEGQDEWYQQAFNNISNDFHEIRAAVIFNKEKSFLTRDVNNKTVSRKFDFSITGKTILACKNNFSEKTFQEKPFFHKKTDSLIVVKKIYKSTFISGSPGNFKLRVNNKYHYIRGVAYNTGHDWRDGRMPLTRRQLESDFKIIKEMGANTIRRYSHNIYDKNVLNVAGEYDLQVIYGFWFDPKVDYYRDSSQVQEYIKDALDKVKKFRDHPSVLAWALGNETWGLLKHKYAKPYLTKVRESYIKMIEQLAEEIHALDPNRPVLSCIEHEEYQLPGELVAFHDGAHAIDFIGINSYYKEQISNLNRVCYQFDSLRPYLISEFGPRGYWDPHHNKTLNGSQIEDNDAEKARWYREQWINYVNAYKGYNIGGFAYCWHDRMEGSYTWFGLSDFMGRPKPSYYALKELWTKQKDDCLPTFKIETPPQLEPGKEYLFKATADGPLKKDLTYEWMFLKDEYLGRVDNIVASDDGQSALVKIPSKPSRYRLYLFVSDAQKKVTTCSFPVLVK